MNATMTIFSNWVNVADELPNAPTEQEKKTVNGDAVTVLSQEVIIMLKNGNVRTSVFKKAMYEDTLHHLHNSVFFECSNAIFSVDDVSCWLPLPKGKSKYEWVSVAQSNPELGYTPANLRDIIKRYKLRDWQTLNIIKAKSRNALIRHRTDVGMENHNDMAHEKWLLLLEYVKLYDKWATTPDVAEREELRKLLYEMRGGDLNPNSKAGKKAAAEAAENE